jgi:hypothetical protein
MSIAESVLPEFDHEMASTRKMLERVPEAAADWKPHEKSMSLGVLAAHVANLPTWGVMTMDRTELDLAPPGGVPFKMPGYGSQAGNLAAFDAAVIACRAALAAASDADFMTNWSLLNAGQVWMTMPRVVCIRSFLLNHLIHHRGQLSVYLRLQNVPLPGVYGPSADEM